MITNKDIRVENGFLIINGDKFPLDGQSPETIMQIVEDNSDTTPTENSTAPVTSGGVYTALGTKQGTLTFDTEPTASSNNPVKSGGIKTYVDNTIKSEYVSGNIATLDANSRTTIEIVLTIPNGYSALGITSAFTSSSNVAVVGYYVNSSTGKLNLVCANLSASTVSGITVAATCIYLRQ